MAMANWICLWAQDEVGREEPVEPLQSFSGVPGSKQDPVTDRDGYGERARKVLAFMAMEWLSVPGNSL